MAHGPVCVRASRGGRGQEGLLFFPPPRGRSVLNHGLTARRSVWEVDVLIHFVLFYVMGFLRRSVVRPVYGEGGERAFPLGLSERVSFSFWSCVFTRFVSCRLMLNAPNGISLL